ncbi:Protein of uncharacterised function (DUF2490) (plasmid) [Legionella adelaidensis]|uniref:Protein of uncharacterized function (DUF2490) n=1 Tax=Legionella adelaidensis TaxID=45056 RepID=A0A0W0R386_9GAMM|nr:DUF2490 domain-containing protein [Legionella adelaidensis]KTC65537.1 hypothetical protein Lade_0195 [Legionella adelaidensis]VEH84642.1 Protein of uncharacterised function (DUF2490) [Legionella adelaidensis]
MSPHRKVYTSGKIYIFAIWAVISSISYADQTFKGSWNAFTLTTPQKEHSVFFYYKVEARFFNDNQQDEFLTRPAFGYMVTKKLSLWLGYDLFQRMQNSARYTQAYWQQLQTTLMQTSQLNLGFRNRIEARYNHLAPKTAFRDRARAFFTFNDAISKGISPVIYDEIFFNLNHPQWVSAKTISQNRYFAGIEWQLDKYTNLLVGYLERNSYERLGTIRDHLLSIELEVKL